MNSSWCIRTQSCDIGMLFGTNSDHFCGGIEKGRKYGLYCPMSSCTNGGEISGCTVDPHQKSPNFSLTKKLYCQEMYTVTDDGRIHCRAQDPPLIVKCTKWSPVVCDNCEDQEHPWHT
ncbi:secreted protein [Melampsora americana]|nr:secreted protein [Melampsora americana]